MSVLADLRPAIAIFLADPSRSVADQVTGWVRTSNGSFRLQVFATARQLVRRMEYERPDLLLLDVAMPHFDGLTALRSLGDDRTPMVLLSPDTSEGARLTVETLLAGASDYLVKRGSGRERRLAISRTRFSSRIHSLIETQRVQEGPAPAQWDTDAMRVAGSSEWVRLHAVDERLRIRLADGDPFLSDEEWTGVVMATPRSLSRMIRTLTAAPDRPGGPVLLWLPQARTFARALREAASRSWNRAVLELRQGEALRRGQWRLLPGRTMLSLRADRGPGSAFDLQLNRVADEQRAAALQLRLLEAFEPGRLRVFLVEAPRGPMLDPVRRLVSKGQSVFLHSEELAGCRSALEGMGAEREEAQAAVDPAKKSVWRSG